MVFLSSAKSYSLSISKKCKISLPNYIPRAILRLNRPSHGFLRMGRRKTQKIIKTGPKNVTTGMCPLCKTIGRIFIIGQTGKERAKCPACNQEFDL